MIGSAPAFWGREPGPAAGLLMPLGAAWDAAGRLRRALARPYRAARPVVCIGNLMAGGAGKTPVSMAIAKWLGAHGHLVHIVTRGYGGRLAGPLQVDHTLHGVGEVGDEALLLARCGPAWVARDRVAGVIAAVAEGAQIVVLDDGFQNPAIAPALSLVVVDAGYGFGNRRVIPAGPLRENLCRGLARADAVVLVAADGPSVCTADLQDRAVVPAELAPLDGERFAGRRVFAFAGIGRPAKFFASLRRLGAELAGTRCFPDHYRYSGRDLAALRHVAESCRADLVTTAKDFVRLPPALRRGVAVLEVEIHWPDPVAVAALLAPVVSSVGARGCAPDAAHD